jgi:hypothetical protein
MKIIFLDHDGVICLPGEWRTRFTKERAYRKANPDYKDNMKRVPAKFSLDDLNGDAVSLLNEILRATDAEIVVSSDWRLYAPLEEMKEYYLDNGIIKAPIDYTPEYYKIAGEGEDKLPNPSRAKTRQFEIWRWINLNKEKLGITNWVTIDDLYLAAKHGEENPFAIPFAVTTNEIIGLDKYKVEEAITILNK